MPYKDERDNAVRMAIEIIYREALKQVDILASTQHYLVFGEIKVIWKKEDE